MCRRWCLVAIAGAMAAACVACSPSPATTTPAASPTITVSPAATQLAHTPSPTVIDTGSWVSFASERHGFSVEHPPDWETKPATDPWFRNTISLIGSTSLDRLDGGDVLFHGESQPIAAEATAAAWVDEYVARLEAADPGCARPLDEWETVTIDGREGIAVETCEILALVTTDGRGYEFRMNGRLDRGLFDALLQTLTLEPDRAIDEPPPS